MANATVEIDLLRKILTGSLKNIREECVLEEEAVFVACSISCDKITHFRGGRIYRQNIVSRHAFSRLSVTILKGS